MLYSWVDNHIITVKLKHNNRYLEIILEMKSTNKIDFF